MLPFNTGQTVLPRLAKRAQAKFDRLSFREPGDKSARERKERLEAEIVKINKDEIDMKRKLDEMRNRYLSRPEVEEVDRSLISINMKAKDMSSETKELCKKVGEQVDETKRALIQALVPKSVVDSDSMRVSKDLGKKKKESSQRQRDYDLAKLKVMITDFELQKLENRQTRLQQRQQKLETTIGSPVDKNQGRANDQDNNTTSDESNGDSSAYHNSSSSKEELESKPTLTWETQTQTVGIAAKDRGLEGPENEDMESTIQQEDGNQNARASEAPSEAAWGVGTENDATQSLEADTIGPLGQPQNNQVSRDIEIESSSEMGSVSTRSRQNGNRGDKDQGEATHTIEADVSSNEENEQDTKSQPTDGGSREVDKGDSLNRDKRLKRAIRKRRQMKKHLIDVRHDIDTLREELVAKKAEREKHIQKRDRLETKVSELKHEIKTMSLDEKGKGRNGVEDENDRQWQENRFNDWKLQVEEMERQINRELALEKVRQDSNWNRQTRWRRRMWLYGSDSDVDGEGNNDGNHIDSLRKVIDEVGALEERIRDVRKLNEKIDNAVDLRIVLERELDLEIRWLKREENAALSSLEEDSPVPETKDHFSSSIPDEFKFYERLGEGEVRLLVVWPAPADHFPLLCTLETCRLGVPSLKPQYAALSYFWGPDQCNGRLYLVQDNAARSAEGDAWGSTARYAVRIPIRNNLFRGLLRLRRSDFAISLWVDVMCINQSDVIEKTSQLAQLINIYRHAENVCIWLGESDEKGRSEEAMKLVRAIMDFAVLDRYAQDPKQAGKWYGLAELMRDRWFSRRWVVQEISLARAATVHCGDMVVQWPDFADAVSLLVSNQETIKKLFDYSEWRDGPNTLGDIQSFGAYILLEATSKLFLRTAGGEITRPVKNLESLVTSLKTFDVTDLKDLIYSLVCIASDTPQSRAIYSSKQDQVVPLDVNYEKLPTRVYEDFIKFCIMSSESLDILCRPWAMPLKGPVVDENGAVSHLPSWIPLLSQSEFGVPEEVYSGRKNGENLVGAVGRPNYKASAGRVYDASLFDEQLERLKFLPVVGFKLAKIGKISSRITGGVILRDSLKMGGWAGLQKNTTSVPDKIWRTLVADRDSDAQIPPTWYQRACMRCLELADTFNNGDLNIGELLTGNSELIRKYLTRVRSVTWNRRFFEASMENESHGTEMRLSPNKISPQPTYETSAGSVVNDYHTNGEKELFGLGPPDMAVDDYVCILIGCSVPVVLRKEDGGMKLIGEVYVHGKMEGEAMEDLEDGTTWGKEERFELK